MAVLCKSVNQLEVEEEEVNQQDDEALDKEVIGGKNPPEKSFKRTTVELLRSATFG